MGCNDSLSKCHNLYLFYLPFLFITINYIDLINIYHFISNVVEELCKLATITIRMF